jgi:hypothetical protein
MHVGTVNTTLPLFADPKIVWCGEQIWISSLFKFPQHYVLAYSREFTLIPYIAALKFNIKNSIQIYIQFHDI